MVSTPNIHLTCKITISTWSKIRQCEPGGSVGCRKRRGPEESKSKKLTDVC